MAKTTQDWGHELDPGSEVEDREAVGAGLRTGW